MEGRETMVGKYCMRDGRSRGRGGCGQDVMYSRIINKQRNKSI